MVQTTKENKAIHANAKIFFVLRNYLIAFANNYYNYIDTSLLNTKGIGQYKHFGRKILSGYCKQCLKG